MSIQSVSESDKQVFNLLAPHPLQSWEWGEFRKKTGIAVVRLGRYDGKKLVETAQITIHPIPFTSWTIGYFPRGHLPSPEMMEALVKMGKEQRCVFVKMEPNIQLINQSSNQLINQSTNRLLPSPHPLFTKYTFQLDITKSEEELLKGMHPKTRYNIKVAQKNGVMVQEDDAPVAFEEYLRLTFETTKRQKFYAHTETYHRLMWETLLSAGIAHLFTARYEDRVPSQTTLQVGKQHILVTWIVFLFNDVLYYPYGASSDQFRNTMASNLMMWDVIRWGKAHGAKRFDMWGALGPDPDPKDSWYGFHRFKQGYGAEHVAFLGSYDLVIEPLWYKIYNAAHYLRQFYLRIRSL